MKRLLWHLWKRAETVRPVGGIVVAEPGWEYKGGVSSTAICAPSASELLCVSFLKEVPKTEIIPLEHPCQALREGPC